MMPVGEVGQGCVAELSVAAAEGGAEPPLESGKVRTSFGQESVVHRQCPEVFGGPSGRQQVETVVAQLHLTGPERLEKRRCLPAPHPGEHALRAGCGAQGLEEPVAGVLGVGGTQHRLEVLAQSAAGAELGAVALFLVPAAVAVQVEGDVCAVHADGGAGCAASGQHPVGRTSGTGAVGAGGRRVAGVADRSVGPAGHDLLGGVPASVAVVCSGAARPTSSSAGGRAAPGVSPCHLG